MTNWGHDFELVGTKNLVFVNDGTMTFTTTDFAPETKLETIADCFAASYDFNGFKLGADDIVLRIEVTRNPETDDEESDQFNYCGSYFNNKNEVK